MNERMIELAIQARNYALDQKRHYERVHNTEQCLEEYREVYNEKFAELIVKECAELTRWKEFDMSVEQRIRLSVYQDIKEHFGVGE